MRSRPSGVSRTRTTRRSRVHERRSTSASRSRPASIRVAVGALTPAAHASSPTPSGSSAGGSGSGGGYWGRGRAAPAGRRLRREKRLEEVVLRQGQVALGSQAPASASGRAAEVVERSGERGDLVALGRRTGRHCLAG